MIVLGLDPALTKTGWGVVSYLHGKLQYKGCGEIKTPPKASFAKRLNQIFDDIQALLSQYSPDAVAVEEVFVNKNPQSTLKLGMARGVILLAGGRSGLPVAEYAANTIKKSVVGAGHADKHQVETMVKMLLPAAQITSPDAADALAAAITHCHHYTPAKECAL